MLTRIQDHKLNTKTRGGGWCSPNCYIGYLQCCGSASSWFLSGSDFHLMPIQIRILPLVLHLMENQNFVWIFLQQSQVSFFIFLSIVHCRCDNFFYSILTFFGKKYSLPLHLVEMNTDPATSGSAGPVCRSDSAKMCRFDRTWSATLLPVRSTKFCMQGRVRLLIDPPGSQTLTLHLSESQELAKVRVTLDLQTSLVCWCSTKRNPAFFFQSFAPNPDCLNLRYRLLPLHFRNESETEPNRIKLC